MKRILGPSWTAEQVAAGERFKKSWLEFFDHVGAAAPVMPPDFDAEVGSRAAIRTKHEARLLAYPNVVGISEGTRMRRGKPAQEPVIVVLVSQKIPRKRLAQDSLLPSHIDGVPIDVVEVSPIEALSYSKRTRAGAVRGRPSRRQG